MEKISVNKQTKKFVEINSYINENEYIVWIKIRLKGFIIYDFFIDNYPCLIIIFCLFTFLALIFFLIIVRTKSFIDIFYDGKIYYKNIKDLKLNKIQKQIKNY